MRVSMLEFIGHLCSFCELSVQNSSLSIVSFVSSLFVTYCNKHLCINKTLLICNHSWYVMDADSFWVVSVSSILPVSSLSQCQPWSSIPQPSQGHRACSGGARTWSQLPDAKSPLLILLLPLLTVLSNKELLLPDLPGGSSPLLSLKIPPFGSLFWLRHQTRDVISRDDLEFPRRGGNSLWKPHSGGRGGSFLSTVTRI